MNNKVRRVLEKLGISVVAVLLSQSAIADQRKQTKMAEYLFQKLEAVDGLVPSSSANAPMTSDDGYYYRQYGPDRFGIKLNSNDDGFYKSANGGPWALIGNYSNSGNEYSGSPIIVIGLLNTKFGRLIKDDALVISSEIATNNPVLIAKHKSAWTDADKSRIIQAYNAGYPVAIVEPRPSDIEAMKLLIGEDQKVDTPTVAQSIWGAVNLPKHRSVLNIAKHSYYSKQGKIQYTKGGFMEDAVVVSSYFDWLRDADRSRDGMLASALNAANPLNELDTIARAQINENIYRNEGNVYVLQTYYWVAYEKTKGQYWIYAKQEDQLAAFGAYKNINDRELKGLTNGYWYYNYPRGETNKNRIFTYQSSPATTVGSTTTTSGISWSIGGEVGLDGPSISTGVSVDSSYSYETPDLVTNNLSGQLINDVNYGFIIAYPHDCNTCFPRIPHLANTTFKPITEWVWRISPDVATDNPKGLVVDQYFHAELYDYNYYRYPYLGWYVENNRRVQFQDSFAVKWPVINK